jgi:hypothetical protein
MFRIQFFLRYGISNSAARFVGVRAIGEAAVL